MPYHMKTTSSPQCPNLCVRCLVTFSTQTVRLPQASDLGTNDALHENDMFILRTSFDTV